MGRFKKDDIETHSDGPRYLPNRPAINVKVHNWPLTADEVMERFGCDQKTAENALEFTFNSIQTMFLEEAQEIASNIFGNVKVYSEGRSGGWLVVAGLTDIPNWDAVLVNKWGKFSREIKEAIKSYLDKSRWLEDIESNRWAEEGAEEYNFFDTKDGKTACIPDLRKAEREGAEKYIASLPSHYTVQPIV